MDQLLAVLVHLPSTVGPSVSSPQSPDFQPKSQSAEDIPTVDKIVIMDKSGGVTITLFPPGSTFTSDAAFRALGLSCRHA